MRRPIPKQPDRDAFVKITFSRYRHMAERVAEKKNKKGRIIRVGRALPFTLPEFRDWVLQLFGMSYGSTVRCKYCRAWVDLARVQFDHGTPLSRGGLLELSNLFPSCDPCNSMKGSLTADEYLYLLKCLAELHPAAESDVKNRLQVANKFKAGAQRSRMLFQKMKGNAAIQEDVKDGF